MDPVFNLKLDFRISSFMPLKEWKDVYDLTFRNVLPIYAAFKYLIEIGIEKSILLF